MGKRNLNTQILVFGVVKVVVNGRITHLERDNKIEAMVIVEIINIVRERACYVQVYK